MVAFAKSSDVETLLQVTFDEAEVSSMNLQLELVTAAMLSRIHQEVFLGTSTVTLDGVWSRSLVLPQWPVVSVASVVIDGTTLASGWRHNDMALIRQRGGGVYIGNGGAVHSTPHWGGPDCEIEVEYTHGYAEGVSQLTPFKAICLSVIQRNQDIPTGIESESMEDWSVTYSSDLASQGMLGFTEEEIAIMERFPRP